ncbi:Inositol-pentakisphosphate 2-kinase [Mycena kentingensis (nom. inval.)]|nr:Inositol-pentakisphosphate 2-kinase [Mycena kentingensis (nom. inval.)]
MSLSETRPDDWAYLSEGGATIVFSYAGAPNPAFDGKVLRVRKRPINVDDAEEHAEDEDPSVVFHQCVIERIVPSEYLVRPEPLVPPPTEWLQDLAGAADVSRPAERRYKDTVDVKTPRLALATDLVGGEGVAVEIKPKWGFLPSPEYLSDETRPVKTRTCRFCMHTHMRAKDGEAVSEEYCPLDLYSGDKTRMRMALDALWQAWSRSHGTVNNLRVFVKGQKLQPDAVSPVSPSGVDILTQLQPQLIADVLNPNADPKNALISALSSALLQSRVLEELSSLQRRLDALDVEGLQAICDLSSPGPEPTISDWTAWLVEHAGERDPTTPRHHALSYLLSATFKDCSIIVRIPPPSSTSTATVTIIDLDVKSIDRLHKWAKLDRKIVEAYMEVPEAERRVCVDARRSTSLESV